MLPKYSRFIFHDAVSLKHSRLESYIRLSKVIDFQAKIRGPIEGICDTEIPIYPSRKRMSEAMKWSLVAVASDYGATDLDSKKQLELFNAVIRVQSYLYGFKAPAMSIKYFQVLWRKFKRRMNKNPTMLFNTYLSKVGCGRTTWVDKMMQTYPKLLHTLYRYATKILSCSANTRSLIACMKRRSKVLYPDCPVCSDLKLTKFHFWEWFHKCGGILKRPTTKNRLTPEQRREIKIWSLQMKLRLKRLGVPYICFMDDKWFYTTSRRKKIKILPRAEFENEEDAFMSMPKLRNRRHALKVMFLSIIAKPELKHGFDGKILLKRVSEIIPSAKTSYNQKFSDEYEINHALKAGEWKNLFLDSDIADMDIEELIERICEFYNLDDNTQENLTFTYVSHSNTGKTRKIIHLNKGPLLHGRIYVDDNGVHHPLFIDQLKLEKHVPANTPTHHDVSCDTKFMLSNVDVIGKAIRSAYHFVDPTEIIYLVLDNAGGHGTVEAKEQFEERLRKKYRVKIIWQVPNSPDTNLLDLGAWCTIQSDVEDIHRLLVMDNDVLANSVEQEFSNLSSTKLDSIYDRWDKVLDLILKNSGGNDLVETCRGKMKLEEIKHFVSSLDKKDGLLLDVDPDVQDDSEDDTISDLESSSDTETEDDSTDDEDEVSVVDGEDAAVEYEYKEGDPSDVVAEAVAEVVVEGHRSVDFMEGGHVYTSDKTAQICVSSLSGRSDYDTDTDIEEDDE